MLVCSIVYVQVLALTLCYDAPADAESFASLHPWLRLGRVGQILNVFRVSHCCSKVRFDLKSHFGLTDNSSFPILGSARTGACGRLDTVLGHLILKVRCNPHT